MNDILTTATTQIVWNYVTHNTVSVDQLPNLIERVGNALLNINGNLVFKEVSSTKKDEVLKFEGRSVNDPAVPIEESVTDEYIICLEDGKKLKMLKRHLRSFYGMKPDDYRRKWNLSKDYPMVCSVYAEHRSRLAKGMGLGTRLQPKISEVA